MSQYILKYFDTMNSEEISLFEESQLGKLMRKHYLRNECSVRFYLDYFGEGFKERSLILFKGNFPEIVIPALCKEGEINFANNETEILSVLKDEARRKSMLVLFKKIKDEKKLKQGTIAKFKNDTFLLKEFVNHLDSVELKKVGVVDFKLSQQFRKQNIRKSYKSLINWGEKNLTIEKIDQSNLMLEKFNLFKSLHIEASGRQIRSDESWNQQFEIIKNGYGFLINAYMNSKIVSGCFIMHDKNTAIYGVAASNRTLMSEGMPLNHFNLWKAISVAYEKGCNLFVLGDIEDKKIVDKKLQNLALFKRGFASDIFLDKILNIKL